MLSQEHSALHSREEDNKAQQYPHPQPFGPHSIFSLFVLPLFWGFYFNFYHFGSCCLRGWGPHWCLLLLEVFTQDWSTPKRCLSKPL